MLPSASSAMSRGEESEAPVAGPRSPSTSAPPSPAIVTMLGEASLTLEVRMRFAPRQEITSSPAESNASPPREPICADVASPPSPLKPVLPAGANADDGRDRGVERKPADAAVTAVGDEDRACAINRHTGGRVELCTQSSSQHAVAAETRRARRAGDGVDRPADSLKFLAEHLALSPATVSLVINRSPAAKSIPHRTQERIRIAARELNYRPNFMARSLRAQRSFTIGVVVPEISEGYAALVMSGIEDHLLEEGYFYFVVSHRHRADLILEYPRLLQQRAVEGLIAVDTTCQKGALIPVVAVLRAPRSGRRNEHRIGPRARRQARNGASCAAWTRQDCLP